MFRCTYSSKQSIAQEVLAMREPLPTSHDKVRIVNETRVTGGMNNMGLEKEESESEYKAESTECHSDASANEWM